MKNKNEIMSISEAIIDYLQREHCGKALAVKATELQRRFGVTPRQLRFVLTAAGTTFPQVRKKSPEREQ